MSKQLNARISDEIYFALSESISNYIFTEHLKSIGFKIDTNYRRGAILTSEARNLRITDINLLFLQNYYKSSSSLNKEIPVFNPKKSIGSPISRYDNLLGYTSISSVEKIDANDFNKYVILGRTEFFSLQEIFSNLEEQTQQSVELNDNSRTENLLNLYVEIFFKIIKAESDYYKTMPHSVINTHWHSNILDYTNASIHNILQYIHIAKSKEILYLLIELKFKISSNIITGNSSNIFRFFINDISEIYSIINNINDIKTKDLGFLYFWDLCKKTFFYSTNIHDYPLIKKTEIIEKEIILSKFIEPSLIFLNKLIKTTIDNLDFNGYKNTSDLIDNIYLETLFRTKNEYLYDISRSKILSDFGKDNIQENISSLEILSIESYQIFSLKSKIWLGIGVWLTYLIETQKTDLSIIKQMFEVISSKFNSLKDLTQAYIDSTYEYRNFRDRLNWIQWELYKEAPHYLPLTTLSPINRLDFDKFYVLLATTLATSSKINLPTSDNFTYSASEIIKVGDNIIKNPIWKNILPKMNIKERMKNLVYIHNSAQEIQKLQRENQIIDAEISQGLKTEFAKLFMDSWNKTSYIYNILKTNGMIEELNTQDYEYFKNIGTMGHHLTEDKFYFMEAHNKTIKRIANNYAQHYANDDENLFLSELSATNYRNTYDSQSGNVSIEMDMAIQSMKDAGYKPNAIFLKYEALPLGVVNSKKYNRDNKESDFNTSGTYDGIPLYMLSHISSNNIYILDLSKFMRFYMLYISQAPGQLFWIHISDITKEEADEWSSSNPNTSSREFQQRVSIKIYKRNTFKIRDINAAALIKYK